MNRANIGCETQFPDGWQGMDITDEHGAFPWDIREPMYESFHRSAYDSAVCHHVLSMLDHHELVPALQNIRAILKPGGTLRVSDINLVEGFTAWTDGRSQWFPQDQQIPNLDARFCTWLTWFGTRKSVFTPEYMRELLNLAGFVKVGLARHHFTWSGDEVIVDLDRAGLESFYMEGVAP